MSSSDDEKRATESALPIPIPSERRQVSVLFADMVEYTATVERLGEENALAFIRMIYDKLTGVVRGHGGSVRGFAGDSVMAGVRRPGGAGGRSPQGVPDSLG